MAIDIEQFKELFFEESFEGLSIMETGLLALVDNDTDLDTVNDIFRAAHSIKGGSATFGLGEITSLTHVAEELLDEMRNGKREADKDVVNILLESVDALRGMLDALHHHKDPDCEAAERLKSRLEQVLNNKPENNSSTHESKGQILQGQAAGTDLSDSPQIVLGWQISFCPHPSLLQSGNDPVLLLRELALLGELTVTANLENQPSWWNLDPEIAWISWDIWLNGDVPEADILEIFEWVEDDCDLALNATLEESRIGDRRATDRRKEGRRDNNQSSTKGPVARSSGGSIRVSTDRVDALVDMVGELIITQSMLSQVGTDFTLDRLDALREGLSQLERSSRELQESVMQIRMQPISFAFNRFPRMVHDLGEKLGKLVRLEVSGEDTEMDKTVMEKISDPLVHLVRNSMDHGLEPPDERTAVGKEPEGVISLSAYHQGGDIVVDVIDDGRGLNHDKILSKAIEQGIVSAKDKLTLEQIYPLIFRPGFSTVDEVSDVSGRGVGMDVVRRNIEELGGHVDVISNPGLGSKFTIRLPLTLAILDGQLLRLQSQTYVLPLVSIVESLQIHDSALSSVTGAAEVYRLREDYIPIVRLAEILGIEQQRQGLQGALLIVVESGPNKLGLVVDDILAQQQVVVKNLETNFRRVRGISGATILGDGAVSLIIDIPAIIEMARLHSPTVVSHSPITPITPTTPSYSLPSTSNRLGQQT